MKRRSAFLILMTGIAALVLHSCAEDDEMSQNNIEDSISIESYAYANEAIEYIKLCKIGNNGFSNGQPLTEANVVISQGGNTFNFVLSDSLNGTYIPVDSSLVMSENELLLTVHNEGLDFAFPLTFPPKVENVYISETQIALRPQELDSTISSISWNAIEGYQYCIFMRHFGTDTIPVNYLDGIPVSSTAFYTVHSSNHINLKTVDFPYYGTYHLYVTAVDANYAVFYNNPLSQAIVETLDGSSSAWGIFAAFNGESIEIQVN